MFRPGSPVFDRVSKLSACPGPRARDVQPATKGDTYTYVVDKFWTVADVKDDGKLLLRTRRGKQHVVNVSDPQLRHPRWWERLFYRSRFPKLLPNDGS